MTVRRLAHAVHESGGQKSECDAGEYAAGQRPSAGVQAALDTGNSRECDIRARAATRRLPPEVDRRIREMAPAYEAGFREGYREILASRYSKQIVGGSLLGMAAGFTALVYMFSMYAD